MFEPSERVNSPLCSQENLVGIVGHACRVAGASNVTDFWDIIERQKDVRRAIPADRFCAKAIEPYLESHSTSSVANGYFLDQHPGMFDASFFRISKTEAEAMDPQQRLLLEVVFEALEDAGIPASKIRGSSTSVFTGSFSTDYQRLIDLDLATKPKYAATGLGRSMLSNRISHFFDLRGESIALDTACSSGLTALHLAQDSVKSGRSDMAIVAASALHFHPGLFSELQSMGMLSEDGVSRAFSADASGYARGEGVAAIILQAVKDADRDNHSVKAVIKASVISHNGTTSGITMPSRKLQENLIKKAYQTAHLDPSETAYFEGHGTGTTVGDREEVEAIASVFTNRNCSEPLYLGSAKTNFGHTEGAAGLISVIKSTLALQKAVIPPNMHFTHPNKSLKLHERYLKVLRTGIKWPVSFSVRRASVNSFGYGGSNAHVILEEYTRSANTSSQCLSEDNIKTSGETRSILVPLSSNSEAAGREAGEKLAEFIAKGANINLADLAHTLATRRSLHSYRRFILVDNMEDLIVNLKQPAEWTIANSHAARVGFVFSGQGVAWAKMGLCLLQNSVFRDTLQLCDDAIHSLPDGPSWHIIEELCLTDSLSHLEEPEYSQPISTSVQIAIVEVLRSWNITPTACCGHSSGELAAAYASGILSLDTSVIFAYYRGTATTISSEVPGAMLAVGMPEVEALKIVEDYDGRVRLAAVNSPVSCTVSGDADYIAALEDRLHHDNIFYLRLKVTRAYHSHHMLPCSKIYENLIKTNSKLKEYKKNNLAMFSSVTARPVKWSDMDSSYWIRNLISPVRFSEALTGTILNEYDEQQVDILVEIGGDSVLKGPAQQVMSALKRSIPYITTLSKGIDDFHALQLTAGHLFSSGASINIDAANNTTTASMIQDLPSHAWNHQKYWTASRMTEEVMLRGPCSSLLGMELPGSTPRSKRWRKVIRSETFPFLRNERDGKVLRLKPDTLISIAIDGAVFGLSPNPRHTVVLKDMRVRPTVSLRQADSVVEMVTELVGLNPNDSDNLSSISVYTFTDSEEMTEVFHASIFLETKNSSLTSLDGKSKPLNHSKEVFSLPQTDDCFYGSVIHPDHLYAMWNLIRHHLQASAPVGQELSIYPASFGTLYVSLHALNGEHQMLSRLEGQDPYIHFVSHSANSLSVDVHISSADEKSPLISHFGVEYEHFDNHQHDKEARLSKSNITQSITAPKGLRDLLNLAADKRQKSEIIIEALTKRLSLLTGIETAEILPTNRLSNFGLDSLMASNIRNWFLKEAAIELPLGDLLLVHSIQELVAKATEKLITSDPSVASTNYEPQCTQYGKQLPRSSSSSAPLSRFQRRIWFTQSLFNDPRMFNCRLLFHLHGNPKAHHFRSSLKQILKSNRSFRTAYIQNSVDIEQRVVESRSLDFVEYDLSNSLDPKTELEKLSRSIQGVDLDLTQGDCCRFGLVKMAVDSYCLIFIVHHLAFDRGSCLRFLRQMTSFYDDSVKQRASDLSPWRDTNYIDFTLWHNEQTTMSSIESKLNYWRKTLSGCSERSPTFPHVKSTERSLSRIDTSVHRRNLDPRLLHRMKRLCGDLSLTPFHFVLASWMAFIYRYTGETDLIVLAVESDRSHPDVSETIGLFINMLPMRLIHDYEGTVYDVMKAIKGVASAATNNSAPFDEVVKTLKLQPEAGIFPLSQIAINYQVHGTMPKCSTVDFGVESVSTEDVPTACDLSIEVIEDPEHGLRLALEHSVALYEPRDISRLLGNFSCFLASCIKDHLQPINEVPMAGEDEISLLQKFWKEPNHHEIRVDMQMASQIQQHALEFPENQACVTSEGGSITYHSLVKAAKNIAARLTEEGVQPGSHVGLYTEPGTHQIIAMVAILFCRSAYVALDPKFAKERLRYMVRDAQAQVILVGKITDDFDPHLLFDNHKVIGILEASRDSREFSLQEAQLQDPFYVTYTSGSTGKPKGIVMRHSNATPMLDAIVRQYNFNTEDRFLHQITMAFDLSVVEIWTALLVGGTICIASESTRKNPTMLAKYMHDAATTFAYFTPTQFGLLLDANTEALSSCHNLRLLWFCGEKFPRRLAETIYRLGLSTKIYNTYGPCESMVQATIFQVPLPDESGKSIPIGHALPSVQHYILDSAQNPLPIGVAGELYLGGPQVGTEYLDRPDTTTISFFDDKFAGGLFECPEVLGGKMFKTGDICAVDGKNILHFLGRKSGDRLIKLRGLRIDLGEIEQNILEFADQVSPGVLQDACVIARNLRVDRVCDDEQQLMDERQLFAFLVLRRDFAISKQSFLDKIGAKLSSVLNEYMVPNGYMFLETLPMTASGKTDRLTLSRIDLTGLLRLRAFNSSPSPSTSSSHSETEQTRSLQSSTTTCQSGPENQDMQRIQIDESLLERTTLQAKVAKLFKELLKLADNDPIEHDTNFFNMGGSSLSMMQLQNMLKREFHAHLPLIELVANPTPAAISLLLSKRIGKRIDSRRPDDPTEALETPQNIALESPHGNLPSQVSVIDWSKEIILPNEARYKLPAAHIAQNFPSNLATDFFLTGADTHQGMHVLSHILENSTSVIHVIGTESPLTLDHLTSRMRHFRLLDDQRTLSQFSKRVNVLTGSMSESHFGLSNNEFVLLGSRTCTIINIGVSVSLLRQYTVLRNVNLARILDLIELAACGSQASTITHLSTFSVPQLQSWHMARRKIRHRVIIEEESAASYEPPMQDEHGYVTSRWAGERILEAAAERGFEVNILRGSAMTGALRTGVPEPAVGVVQHGIMGVMSTGLAPDIPGYVADFVPVDILASWIYTLAVQQGMGKLTKARIYHVTNPSPLPVEQIQTLGRRHKDDNSVEIISVDQWFARMREENSQSNDEALRWDGLRALFSTGHFYWALSNERTMRRLVELGVDVQKCPPVDMNYLRKLYHNWTTALT